MTSWPDCSENDPRGQLPNGDLYAAVAQALIVFAEILANPKELTPQLISAWEKTLAAAGVNAADVEPGVSRLLQTQTFFPTPADFLKVVNPPENKDAAAELAWQRALSAIRDFGGGASLTVADLGGDGGALWALERMGWERVCEELDNTNRAIFRAEFIRLYGAARTCNATVAYLVGRCERQNSNRGRDLTPVLVGRPDWLALPRGNAALPAPSMVAPACSECGGRSRHLLWCSELDGIKALPAGDVDGFSRVIVEEAADVPN